MSKIKVYYDEKGKTISIWFDDPQKEVISEEVGEGVILSKDKKGKVIGFEKLNVDLSKFTNRKGIISLPVELSFSPQT